MINPIPHLSRKITQQSVAFLYARHSSVNKQKLFLIFLTSFPKSEPYDIRKQQ